MSTLPAAPYLSHSSSLLLLLLAWLQIARNCCELYTFDRAALQELAERHPIELGGLLVSPTPPHVGERPDASTAVSIELLQVRKWSTHHIQVTLLDNVDNILEWCCCLAAWLLDQHDRCCTLLYQEPNSSHSTKAALLPRLGLPHAALATPLRC
jgi:hypothetical protein